jgi:hypothetical protein
MTATPPPDPWFSAAELDELRRPTMDRAIEALDAGDIERARELCEGMRYEWRFLHDLMVELIAGLITFVQEEFGEDQVQRAWERAMARGWKDDTEKIVGRDRRAVVEALAASWRAHSTSGVGPHPGAFTIEEDEEKFTFRMNPCGSGQRLWRRGKYEGPNAYGLTLEPHDWSYDRAGFPLYCTHCTFMNELLPLRWYGTPLYPSEPPTDFDHDPCTWYWYKDPADIPDLYRERYTDRLDAPDPAS